MDLLSGAADHVAVAVFNVPEKIKEQQMLGRIEQPVSPVIGRAVQFIGDFLGDQPQEMNILLEHRACSGGLNGNGGAGLSGQDGDLSHKVNGIVPLDYKYISVFKFIDDPVVTLADNAKVIKRRILLVDNGLGRVGLDSAAGL